MAETTDSNGRKRILTKDLDARIAELERKIAQLATQIASIDDRINKITNSLIQSQLR